MPRSGWMALGASMAALVASHDDRRLLVLALLALGGLLLVSGRMAAGQRRLVVALVLGSGVILARSLLAPAAPAPTGIPIGSGPWTMVVETVGSPREGQQVATLRTIDSGPDGFRVAATLPRYPVIEPGDRLDVGGRVRPRPDSPYGRYLERLGAWGNLDARHMTLRERPTDPGARLERLRRDAGDLLTRVLPEPEAGLAAGILIGLRDRVDRDVASTFTTAGVSHVVAISGWNIAIVAAAIAAVAGGLSRRRRAIVTALAIAGYIAFAGASPSVLRAGAMAGVVLIARESGRSGRATAALGWAVVLLLIADPRLIGDAGFQLSTLATAGLIAWATPLTERLDRWTGGRLPRWLGESLGVSLAAQAATLPIVLASFGRLAVIAPIVNLLVVPLVAPAMAAGIAAMVGALALALGAPSVIGAVLAAPGWVALRVMIGIIETAAAVPLASVAFEPDAGVALGLLSTGAGGLVVAWRRHRNATVRSVIAASTSAGASSTPDKGRPRGPTRATRTAAYGLIVGVAVTGAVAISRPAGVARVTVLDVGQGDAILIEGSRGGRLLVDGGPDPDRLLVELDRQLPPWDRRIDAIVLSHPHEDHVAGLALLLQRYRVGRVLEPGMRGPGPGYGAWLARLSEADAPVRAGIAAGDRLAVDEISMLVLWPTRGEVPLDPPDTGTAINNISVVLLGTIHDRRFLLAGDVEQDIDPRLLADGLPRVDLLKVAHHGSRTATTDPFVATVRPAVAVASAGLGNPSGHPARATMERLAAAGARVYRTDRDGSVTVTFEPDGLTVRTRPRRSAARDRPPATDPSAVTAAATVADGPRRAFGCAIPVSPQRSRAIIGPEPPVRRASSWSDPGATVRLGYHRGDDRPRPDRRRCPALVTRSPAVVRRARPRGRRDRRVPRPTDRRPRHRGRSGGGGGGGPVARRRQDPARGRSGPDPPTRLRVGGLADDPRVRGAGSAGRRSSRDPPRGRRRLSALGGLRVARGTGRGLRRQARGTAPRIDGRPVRSVAAPLPRVLG